MNTNKTKSFNLDLHKLHRDQSLKESIRLKINELKKKKKKDLPKNQAWITAMCNFDYNIEFKNKKCKCIIREP